MTKRDVPGFAIGGLSGGESKGEFWRMVALSTSRLPKDKPRYLMGVGYVEERGDAAHPHPSLWGVDSWEPLPPGVGTRERHSPAWEGTEPSAGGEGAHVGRRGALGM